jgi:hypothetical protein
LTQRWTRRPSEVEAIRLGSSNAAEVAAFCDGRADVDDMGDPVVHLPKAMIPVRLGDFAVRDVLPDGLSEARAMKPGLFWYCYSEVVTAGG